MQRSNNQPEPRPTPRKFGLAVSCHYCGTRISNPTVEITHLLRGEKENLIIQYAAQHGWRLVIDGSTPTSPRWVVCPTCQIKQQAAETQPLPAFNPKMKCPKCGWNKVGIEFCGGLVSTCSLGAARDHLHRTCTRCKFDLVQACKDSPKPQQGSTHEPDEISLFALPATPGDVGPAASG